MITENNGIFIVHVHFRKCLNIFMLQFILENNNINSQNSDFFPALLTVSENKLDFNAILRNHEKDGNKNHLKPISLEAKFRKGE